MIYTVYAIYNRENYKIYIGQTADLSLRLQIHNEKTFKGYTSRFTGSWMLIYSEEVDSREKALKRERQLKSFQGRQFIKKFIPSN